MLDIRIQTPEFGNFDQPLEQPHAGKGPGKHPSSRCLTQI